MEKEILCQTLTEAFDYIEQNIEEGMVYTIELTPSVFGKEDVADEI